MTGKQLYTHYRDCYWCENRDMLIEWERLDREARRAWDRLAECVTTEKGCTIPWELAKRKPLEFDPLQADAEAGTI